MWQPGKLLGLGEKDKDNPEGFIDKKIQVGVEKWYKKTMEYLEPKLKEINRKLDEIKEEIQELKKEVKK